MLYGGKALTSSAPLDGRTWLELDEGATVAIRHAVTGRDLSLSGPASVLPCVAGEEEVLLARGTLRASHGLGARPGAEVLLATPLGNVRYADAALDLRLSDKKLEVEVRTGSARLDPAGASRLTGKRELGPRSKASVSGRADPALLVKECEAKAKLAGERARAVLTRNAEGPSLGERAAAHVEARRQARGACMTAAAATALAEEADRAPLRARVAAAERLWKAIPAQIPAGKP